MPKPSPPIQEIFEEHWEFQAGDPVPVWLERVEGVSRLTFTVAVTVHADLSGAFWVVPKTPTKTPIQAVGYGPKVVAKIFGQGAGQLRLLSRPLVDLDAVLAGSR